MTNSTIVERLAAALEKIESNLGPEIHRTRPYTFAELAARWHCDVATVRRRVNGRSFKAGREPLVRVGMVLRIEEELEGRGR